MNGPGLAASTARLLMAESLVVPSGLITAAYLGRTLGPELYGLFSVATAVNVSLEWILGSLLGRTTVKLVGDARDWRPVASTILLVHFATGLAVACGCWLGAGALASWLGDARLGPWLALLAIEIPIAVTATACRNIMTGRGNYRGRALSTGIRWLVRPILVVVLVESGLSVTGAVIGSVVAAAVGWAIASRMAGVSMFRGGWAPIPGIWQLAVPVFVLSLSLRLIDKLGLLAIQLAGRPAAETGFYAAAQNFAIAPGLLALSFSPLLLAELTRLRTLDQGGAVDRLVRGSLRLVVAVLPLAAIGAASSHEIVRLVYGPGFEDAARLAAPLLLTAFGMLLVSVATSVLIACDRASTAARCVWPWVPPSIVALWLVVPGHGALGAALVGAAAIAGAAATSLVAVERVAGLWPSPATSARAVAVSCAAGAVAMWWPAAGGWIPLKLAALALAVPVLFALLGEFAPRPPSTSGAAASPQAASYWDGVASAWSAPASANLWRTHADAVNLATCFRWWPDTPVCRVLKTDLFDEVAGPGLMTELSRRARTAVAVDVSMEATRMAKPRGTSAAVGADVRALPFVDGAFDVVVSNSTLDHFEDVGQIRRALAEIRRVLAPGGRLILTLDNPANPAVRLRNALPFRLLNHLGLVPYFVGATLDAPSLSALVESIGFEVVETTAVLHCPRALAVGGLGAAGHLASPRWQRRLAESLMWFERLERWPSRQRTGYYVALAADAPLAAG
jgi:O-antigen/teichoic acid export membrane protein/SAM-dependent methyltransferase